MDLFFKDSKERMSLLNIIISNFITKILMFQYDICFMTYPLPLADHKDVTSPAASNTTSLLYIFWFFEETWIFIGFMETGI